MIRALLFGLLLLSPALAEVSQQAVDRAVTAFRAGDYRAALVQFRSLVAKAEGRALRARLQFNIARCHEELGQRREAIDGFRRFLDFGGTQATRDRARATIARLERELGGRVRVTCGAGVRQVALANGGRARACPAEFGPIPAGEALVVATAASGVTQRFPVRVVAGETVPLRVDIADLAAAPVEVGAPIDPWPWVVIGGGLAAVGVGVGFYVSNQDGLAALRDDPGNQSLRDQVDSDRAFAITGYVLGGALIAGGLTWLLWPDDERAAAGGAAPPFAWTF